MSITYGPTGSRQHIWSLVLGHTHQCPCDTHNSTYQQPLPPSVAGNNYYCSRVPINLNTPVWQGINCSNDNSDNPCCNHNDPPAFKVDLGGVTTETMELHICSDECTSEERLYLMSAEIYVL